jgi:hypothetical protein
MQIGLDESQLAKMMQRYAAQSQHGHHQAKHKAHMQTGTADAQSTFACRKGAVESAVIKAACWLQQHCCNAHVVLKHEHSGVLLPDSALLLACSATPAALYTNSGPFSAKSPAGCQGSAASAT